MLCFLVKQKYCLLPTTEPGFQNATFLGFVVIYHNSFQAQEYLQPHMSYTVTPTRTETIVKLVKVTSFLFLKGMPCLKYILQFFSTKRNCPKQRKSFDISLGLSERCFTIWSELLKNIFSNASILKGRKWRYKRCHNKHCPFNNYKKHINALMTFFQELILH